MENESALYLQEFPPEPFPEPRSFSMDRACIQADGWQAFSRERWDGGRRRPQRVQQHTRPLFGPRRRSRLVLAGFAIIIALLGALTLWLLGTAIGSALAESGPLEPAAQIAGNEESPASTAKADWRKGTVPNLFQRDAQWASISYGDGTIGTHGCGPTCLAMAYIGLTGRTDKDPGAMALFSQKNGYIDAGVTSWALMGDGARQLGLRSQELAASADAVLSELASGHPVICSVGPGDFTADGHFIVLTAADTAGNVTVNDPNSIERSQRTWDIQRILDQCRNLWALSV